MSHENNGEQPAQQPERQPRTIAVPDLLQWFNEHAVRVDAEFVTLNETAKSLTLDGDRADNLRFERSLGEAFGQKNLLLDFKGFLIAHSVEAKGQIDDLGAIIDATPED
jgi:hypothetical protein